MPPKIYSVKDPLDLTRLHLAKPINKNGSHFIKTLDVDNPIYFLGPKCFSKNGFVKSGKKIFCDFVFSNEDSDFLAWLENLEESSRKSIYTNRETWFETPLDEHDIESSMTSPYKPYKSGKFFIVRANVPTALDKINIKIYDENEKETVPENIKENTKVLAVLEFQGIRCSVRSFQFEIELKQLLVVEPDKLFEKCIIGTSFKNNTPSEKKENTQREDAQEDASIPTGVGVFVSQNAQAQEDGVITLPIIERAKESQNDVFSESFDDSTSLPTSLDQIEQNTTFDVQGLSKQSEDEPIVQEDNANQIEIISNDFLFDNIANLNVDKDAPLKLKNRNDVYYKLYREMRQRAKEAKREALANYLEAKRIKNTYLLEDVSDSESDEDDAQISI